MVSYTVEEIVQHCFPGSSHVIGNKKIAIDGVSDLKSASERHISFFGNARYASDMKTSKAGVIIVPKEIESSLAVHEAQSYILHENPTAAFQAVLTLFHGGTKPKFTGFSGIHPTAVVHPTVELGKNVMIGPYVVLDEGVTVGSDTMILPHVYIGRAAKIGEGCLIHAHAVIREECVLHSRVIIQPGAVIGSCGFGYSTDKKGCHTKLDHWGVVVLEDDVEVGANSTIDRGRFQQTRIGQGTKLDNLVQIAHNVLIGRSCLLVSQVGIAGSTKIGDRVVLAGKVAVNGHIEIGNDIMVAAYSGVSKSLKEPGKYSGIPVQKLDEYNKNAVYLRKIATLFERVKALEEIVDISPPDVGER